MKRLVWALVFVLLARRASAGVGISLGAEGSTTLPDAALGGELVLGADADLYRPLSDRLALLTDAEIDLRYLPERAAVVASGGFSAGMSLDAGPWLTRLELGGVGEVAASWGDAAPAGPCGEASASLVVSWAGRATTVEGETALRMLGGDRIAWAPSVRVGFSGMLGDKVILSADTECGLDLPAAGAAEPVVGVEAVVEWLPDAPLVLRAVAAFERRFSDVEETVVLDGVAFAVPRYWGYVAVSSTVRLSVLLGRRMDLSVDLGGIYRQSDHGAITATGVLSEKEWMVEVEPTVELGLDISRRMAVTLTVADLLVVSNAAPWSNQLTVGFLAHLALP